MHKVKSKPRTAVVLYGFTRTAEVTSGSLSNNVIEPLGADVFYFGPSSTDNPATSHSGKLDNLGYIKTNPKNYDEITHGAMVDKNYLHSIYGDALKEAGFHELMLVDFEEYVSGVNPEQWLFGLNPARFMAMFFNIQQVCRMVCEYQKANKFQYDNIIITRPDSAFYSPIRELNVAPKEVHIPDGVGFCPHSGNPNIGLTSPFFYKNAATGRCIPGGEHFNDQVMVVNGSELSIFVNLLSDMSCYIKEKVPLTPETLLFYHLNVMNEIDVVIRDSWKYEIFRSDDKEITSIVDLVVLDVIDPYHKYVLDRKKQKPIIYALKYIRERMKKAYSRYF